MERYRVMEWLNFITSELHKGFSPLFNPKMPQEAKEIFAARLKDKYKLVDARLEGNDYLMGKQFSVADAYLFTVTNWAAGRRRRPDRLQEPRGLQRAHEGAPRGAGRAARPKA